MAAFLIGSALSRGDLSLFLTNQEGYFQDASAVNWTIYSSNSERVSGKSLPAIRRKCGEYYAPWASDVAGGNYKIVWEIDPGLGQPIFIRTEPFFVVDPTKFTYLGASPGAAPERAGRVYMTGTTLIQGDLPLYLKNSDGYSQDAYSVVWSVFDAAGRQVAPRTYAASAGVGEYYAPWTVQVASGEYIIEWEYQQDFDSALQSISMRFSVVHPAAPYAIYIPSHCPPSDIVHTTSMGVIIPWAYGTSSSTQILCSPISGSTPSLPSPAPVPCPPSPSGRCESFEIPRAIHLAFGLLPPSGAYTNQAPYIIPHSIRNITFFLSYTRGILGGFPALRLLWGNGQEESQETLVDSDISISGETSIQSMFLQELDGPTPSNNDPLNFVLETTVPGGARTVRLVAAEKGETGIPGTLIITLTAATS